MKRFASYLNAVEMAIEAAPFVGRPANLYDPLNYFMELGGKRMRPVAVLMACEMFGKDRTEAIPAALAVEFFHNFSLIHDDIMDNASLRRGMATVHERWNLPVGILSGDLLLIKSYEKLESYPAETAFKLLKEFNRCAALVCEGQQLDMDFAERTDVSVDEYIEMIRLKTAVLLGAALKMGALVANAAEEECEALNQLGIEAGIAFQLADDLLDAYPVSEKFGKKPGGDIIENKKTFLVLTALKLGSEEQKTRLLELMNPALNIPEEQKVQEVKDLFDVLNIPEITRMEAQKRFDHALTLLEGIHCAESAKTPLKELLDLLRDRSF